MGVAARFGQRSGARAVQLLQQAAARTSLGVDLTGRTLGLLGFDRTAQELALRARHDLGMTVLVQDDQPVPQDALDRSGAVRAFSLDALQAQADVVSVHHALRGARRDIRIDGPFIDRLRPDAILIDHIGCGIDQTALTQALTFGLIAAAGLNLPADAPPLPATLTHCQTLVVMRTPVLASRRVA